MPNTLQINPTSNEPNFLDLLMSEETTKLGLESLVKLIGVIFEIGSVQPIRNMKQISLPRVPMRGGNGSAVQMSISNCSP